jgi:hypothetical protein
MKRRETDGHANVLPEYDFGVGVRGQCAARYAQDTTVVVLESDIARAFPAAAAVNRALRALMQAERP